MIGSRGRDPFDSRLRRSLRTSFSPDLEAHLNPPPPLRGVVEFFGSRGRDRTDDQCVNSALLYH
jgi:hypothetical protein